MAAGATSTPAELLYTLVLFGFFFLPGAIVAFKGLGIWLACGWIFAPLVWWYAALALIAKPGSIWAERFYGEKKRQRATVNWKGARAGAWSRPAGFVMLAIPAVIAVSLIATD